MLPDKIEHCIIFMNYWDVSGVFWSFSKCNIKIPHLPADPSTHTLVGGAQTTLTARASVRADRRNDPREALGPRGDTQSRPPGVLDRCAGVTGAFRTARNMRDPPYSSILETRIQRGRG